MTTSSHMRKSEVGEVRPSQTLTTFGIGSLVDFRAQIASRYAHGSFAVKAVRVRLIMQVDDERVGNPATFGYPKSLARHQIFRRRGPKENYGRWNLSSFN